LILPPPLSHSPDRAHHDRSNFSIALACFPTISDLDALFKGWGLSFLSDFFPLAKFFTRSMIIGSIRTDRLFATFVNVPPV
jgi:hypothetical protein